MEEIKRRIIGYGMPEGLFNQILLPAQWDKNCKSELELAGIIYQKLDINNIFILLEDTPGIHLSPHSILNRIVEIFMRYSTKSDCQIIQIGHERLAKYLPYYRGEYTLVYSTNVSKTLTRILWGDLCDDLYEFMELVIEGSNEN